MDHKSADQYITHCLIIIALLAVMSVGSGVDGALSDTDTMLLGTSSLLVWLSAGFVWLVWG